MYTLLCPPTPFKGGGSRELGGAFGALETVSRWMRVVFDPLLVEAPAVPSAASERYRRDFV